MITALDQNTALVIIDLQKGIIKMDTFPHPSIYVVEKAAQLVQAFRSANLPVVVVRVDPSHSPLKNMRVDLPMFPKNAPAAISAFTPEFLELAPQIITQEDDIFITKHTWGAFFNTPLDDELKKRNITGIVLCGIATSIGVEATARAAGERGYNISFATDAMSDRTAEGHEHSTLRIFPRIGELGTTQDIIDQLATRK